MKVGDPLTLRYIQAHYAALAGTLGFLPSSHTDNINSGKSLNDSEKILNSR